MLWAMPDHPGTLQQPQRQQAGLHEPAKAQGRDPLTITD